MSKNVKHQLLIIVLFIGLAPLVYVSLYPTLRGLKVDAASPTFSASASNLVPTPTDPVEEDDPQEEQVRAVILEAISDQAEMSPAFMLNDVQPDEIRISDDGEYASAWLVMREVDSAEPVPSEPGIAFTIREAGEWQAVLPGDPGWLQALQEAPVDVLTPEAQAEWLLMYEQAAVDLPSAPLRGYLLPWAAGKVVSLSQSVTHDRYNPSGNAHFAFDFYVYKSMWEIHASKAGTVWLWKDDVTNNDNSGSGNFIVLQDTTTNPVTYQLYLHLAQNSIPATLKVRGAPVMQGQFIGIADNTGQSTGHHLHFQVHTEPRSYWGQSVDITFADVPINGGRPRRIDAYVNELPYCRSTDVCSEGRQSYTSSNIVRGDAAPPAGDIINVTNGDLVPAGSLLLAGWAVDSGSGVKSIQLIAKYDGTWREIGPVHTISPFTYEWDLCSQDVPDGPVSVALRLVDWHGNQAQLAGLKHFIKSYSCPSPPPACVPAANQAALFSEPNYEGECQLFSIGDHSTTSPFPDDQAASLKVGQDVWVTLFGASGFRERSYTALSSDSNLSDNRVGINAVSSLRVKTRATRPFVPAQVWPPAGFALPGSASTSLFWEDAGGALEFQARLAGPQESISLWQSQPYWQISGLAPGSYTWQVRARNAAGESSWGQNRTLVVSAGDLAAGSSLPLPYQYDVEAQGTWSGSGLWQRESTPGSAFSGEYYWRYGEGSGAGATYNRIRSGDLTSPVIAIPALKPDSSEKPYLRFRYRYDTETQGLHWDQRWVQVSDGGPFQNLLQLADDPMNYWLQSPYIDLSAYAGKDIRVRFYFTSLDELNNGYEGWFIDDIEITQATLPACSTTGVPATGSLLGEMPLAYGERVSGEFCPPGDIDYYRFSGSTGDRIVVDVDAQSKGSDVDAILYLLDQDGASPLAFHDDEVIGERFDPHLGYRLPWDGEYYLKVHPWDHPGAGGSNYKYDLTLFTDPTPPAAGIEHPLSNALLSLEGTITARAADAVTGSGVSHVEFFYHSGDWLNSDWVSLGSDWNREDGWSMPYNIKTEQDGSAFYIRVYDWAGNATVAGAWDLRISKNATRPVYLPVISR